MTKIKLSSILIYFMTISGCNILSVMACSWSG